MRITTLTTLTKWTAIFAMAACTAAADDGPATSGPLYPNSIVSNSIEAMQSGGSLKIGWQHARNGCIAIEIHDSGPGVTAAHMTTLFKPFHTTKSAGLGLGLALSRRIAERLGGTLELQNGVEAGALVTLTLPTSV